MTALVIVCIVSAFVLGYHLSSLLKPDGLSPQTGAVPAENGGKQDRESREHGTVIAATKLWTCSMHPQVRLPNPGKCPICYMDLIPLDTGGQSDHDDGVRTLTMSETAKRLAEVTTSEVKRRPAKVTISMAGMVFEDETRLAALTSRVDGRLDEVYVNFTGVPVKKGDPMVKIWSPTLIKSQVELFESMRSTDSGQAALDPEGVIKGAEEKLVQQGLTREQIERIKTNRKPDLYVTLRAPISGIVLRKTAVLGQFVKEGSEMYMINDLSTVWVKMDAYETDLPWIRFGQDVTFTTPAIPGRSFSGKVLFVDPTLDVKTRSVKVRVEADNPDLLLKPGMFVSADLEAEVDARGTVIKSDWAGKYICPVHPSEPPSPEPGTCPKSKMPLKPASDFGYVDEKSPQLPLTVPATAPLITGKRAIVYVEVPNKDRPTYSLREIVPGPRAGDVYVVYKGLEEGERVVTNGNFKIDSAMQILARPSMMKPPAADSEAGAEPRKAEEEVLERANAPAAFLEALNPTLAAYAELKESLVESKTGEAAKHAAKLLGIVKEISPDLLDAKGKEAWSDLSGTMIDGLRTLTEGQEASVQRKVFDRVSESFARVLMTFRHSAGEPVTVYFCQAAFDGQGAYWVESGGGKRNPYFGQTAEDGQRPVDCAEIVEKIPPLRKKGEEAGAQGTAPRKMKTEDRPESKGVHTPGAHAH
ncbi:MAG: efflux RND transporter periplasmic adaptor subunit [Pseudomonadota bacterium]